jgi:hypothetical protein
MSWYTMIYDNIRFYSWPWTDRGKGTASAVGVSAGFSHGALEGDYFQVCLLDVQLKYW